jgi:hypothetical protein
MIGVDRRFQGKGHGGDLLADALTRIADAADEIGIAVVILDVLDCGNAEAVKRRKSPMRTTVAPAVESAAEVHADGDGAKAGARW